MQDPNEDTEWNDVLRAKGIIPPKEIDLTEEQIEQMVEDTVKEKISTGKSYENMTLEELDEYEDEEDEKVLEDFRRQRLSEIRELQQKAKYGDVREITATDYTAEVNKAGDGIWVVLHLYQPGIPLCTLINNYLLQLAKKYPATKFLKSVSTNCIPNYPDKNLPTLFVYYEGEMKSQVVGPHEFGGMNLSFDELEWKIAEIGAVKTNLTEKPKTQSRTFGLSIRGGKHEDSSDDDDD